MEICSRFGTVKDVMIPEKRTRMGGRYTFARFVDCESIEYMESQLDKLWIGSFKLRANISNFEDRIHRVAERFNQSKGRVYRQAFRKEEISYAETIKHGYKIREDIGQNGQ